MKENENELKILKAKYYTPPVIKALTIELEQSIAAGSALVTPPSNTDIILDEWETGTDQEGDLNW